MTQRKISAALAKIETSRKDGYVLEALLRSYHLNIDLIRHMMLSAKPGYSFENKKFKALVREFNQEISVNPKLKAIINKRTFRLVKTWLGKMDVFFKELRYQQPSATRHLLVETEKIFGVLNISVNKLFVRMKV